ncbi:GL10661 [Drosophila persimilis]|uniref:GL10661 n=1 Tax=Drosophila persimilis TaxID=7234 RepID=B4GAR7_DROPE|nr:probable serine/threonine-protein kinase fhkB [Drosophila persimilis]EDW32019.1 GL10661 [Drosophila persimilis]
MSGKLIMKRKRADQHSRREHEQQPEERPQQQQQQQQHPQHQEEVEEQGGPEKRHRPLTPPAEQPAEGYEEDSPNRILLEALQKIMELQSELDAFEQDLDERDGYQAAVADEEEDDQEGESLDDDNLDAEVAAQFAPPTPGQRSQAEALGFAMCARETLLFLQSEGIPTESPLYQTLLGKLVGQSDGLLHA